ncbi:MAG TPA: replicative DNA helicase [Microlunatus sp.]
MTAEQCVLGAMMLSKDAIADVIEALRGTDFYRPTHEQIYDAIIDLYGRGEPADAVTVSAELGKRGELLRIGGAPYLHDLLSSVPLAANAGFYADIVREKSILRRLADASVRIAQMSYAGEGEVNDIVDRAQAEVYAVTERRAAEDYKPLSELMQPTLDEMEAISSRDGSFAGVPTGFAEFDELTNGLHPGQMIIVAARPGMGKALALDTPLPTPTGWTTMGEVVVGDQLLGRDGRPTTVVAATEVLDHRSCFEVTFSDGSSVVADADHQWRATSRAARRAAAERRPPRYYFDPAVIDRVAALADATTEDDGTYVTMAELVADVGVDLRHALHSVGREIGPAVEVLAVAVGETIRRRVVYPRAQMLQVLAHRIGQPMSICGAATHAEVVTTAEMLATVQLADGRKNWAVDVVEPLELPDADLLVDPYTFGAWLGDGHSGSARITTADPEILHRMQDAGYRTRPVAEFSYSIQVAACRVCGAPQPPDRRRAACGHPRVSLQQDLRTLGVLNNKHIPTLYLRGSLRQRRELLAGLLDTDGTVGVGGNVQYVSTSRRLADGVVELVASLGYRPALHAKAVKGKTPESSVAYQIGFSCTDDVFGLTRKNTRHRSERALDRSRSSHRYVTDIRPVPPVPVRCVQVDNVDHTYLVERGMIPTHNSTLALDLARSASIKNGLTSVIFSLEMSQIEITMRLLSAEASIPLGHIRGGRMSDDDWSRVASKMGQVSEAPLYIDDSPNLTMMEIRAKARRLKQKHDLKLVVIDYIQLMTSGKKVESRQLEVSEFSRQIKLLAKELEVPVVALSQLNRGPEQRTDKRPMLSDLRESGSLEQDADMVVLLNRPDINDKESDRAGEADMDVAKHRNGPTKMITVAFQGHYSRFADMMH